MTSIKTEDIIATLPASTQSALNTLNTAKSAWLEAHQNQRAASERVETIRQRRTETEKAAKAQNEEWRALFKESNGVMTPKMKKLRTEIALDRETLEEFDALLEEHLKENEFLPWETADRAKEYIHAHDRLVELRAMQIWQEFMQGHGKQLIETLSLLKITLGRVSSSVVGVVHTVNDPESVLKDFISKKITHPALSRDALPEEDPVFKLAGISPDYAAHVDFSKASSPAGRHKMLVRREMAAKGETQ